MARGVLGDGDIARDVRRARALMGLTPTPAGTTDHGGLLGLDDDDHPWAVHISAPRTITAQHTFAPSAPQAPFLLGANAQGQTVVGLRADQLDKSILAGAGLTGGGQLIADRTLAVGAGAGITVNADDVALTTPGTLTVASANSSAGSHTHAITSSSNPGAAASLLATNASGHLQLARLGAGVAPVVPLHALSTGEQLRLSYDASNYASFTVSASAGLTLGTSSTGSLFLSPAGDVVLNPAGNDVYPQSNYDLNLGLINRKFLTLHAAELWVETLVAQETAASILGRILVGVNATTLTRDLGSNLVLNGGFEAAGGGGADVFANWVETAGGTGSSITNDTVVFHGGAHAVKLTSGSLGASPSVSQVFTITGGVSYSLSFWTRGDGSAAGLYAVWDVTNSSWITTATSTGVSAATWTKVYVTFKPPAGCTSVQVYFYAATGSHFAHFDDVNLAEADVYTKHEGMDVDDTGYAEAHGRVEFFKVTVDGGATGSGDYLYVVDRDLDGTGSNEWYAGDTIANTGQTGDGFIDIYALNGVAAPSHYGPAIVGNVRNSSVHNDWSETWAVGNLNGKYGYSTNLNGAAFGKYADNSTFITIETTNGLRFHRRFMGASAITSQFQADGDIFIGSNTTSPATTYFAIFAQSQTYNGETMAQGDMLIADNTAGQANILWDKSAGQFLFRGGTTVQAYVDTDGTLRAGGGAVVLGSGGVSVLAPASYTSTNAYKFVDGSGNDVAGMRIKDPFGIRDFDIYVNGVSSSDVTGGMTVNAIGGGHASAGLTADSGSNGISFILTSIPAASTTYATLTGDLKIRDGLRVGSTSSSAANGEIWAAGSIYAGDTSNAGMTLGLTLNQGAADDEILSLKSSDVAHGVTSITETDTYLMLKKYDPDAGGGRWYGLSEATVGFGVAGIGTTEDATRSTAGVAPIVLASYVKSGTSVANPGADKNILAVRSGSATRFILDSDGDSHQDVGTAWTNFDEHDDVALLNRLSAHITRQGDPLKESFRGWLESGRDELERLKLVEFNSDGHHFVNWSRMQMLQIGAIRQLAEQMERYRQALLKLGADPALLEGGQ